MIKITLSNGLVWPAFVRLKEDELFSSWLIRIAHNHRMEYRSFYRIAMQQILFAGKDIDLQVPDIILKNLSISTCTKISRIKESLLSRTNEKFWVIPYSYFDNIAQRRGIMFCPYCLTADGDSPYFRKSWRSAGTFYCYSHDCFLLDRCPKCKTPVIPGKIKLNKQEKHVGISIAQCYNCSYSLKKAKSKNKIDLTAKVRRPKYISQAAQLQIEVDKVLRLPNDREELYKILTFLQSRGKVCVDFKIAVYKKLGFIYQEHKPLKNLPLHKRYYFLKAALWVYKMKPEQVTTFLQKQAVN